jgi:hypothetical protein
MADFAHWATACETRVWPQGTFLAAFNRNQEDAITAVIEGDDAISQLCAFMAGRKEWEGTATALLAALESGAGEKVCKVKGWPKSARSLSGKMRRAAPALRKVGISIAYSPGRARGRLIRITADPAAQFASQPSSASLEATSSDAQQ